MLLPFNTFTIHSLVSFMVTAALAVMFYIVYLKAGRRKLDLLSANFIFLIALMCSIYFLMDNLVPAGMSSLGWEGGPTGEDLSLTNLGLYRCNWAVALFLLPTQLHFVLYYCQKRNFLRRHIWVLYTLAAAAIPTVWTSLWCTASEAPLAETSSWASSVPWLPQTGPAGVGLLLAALVVQVYSVLLLWRTRRLSVTEFAESLGGRQIVFLAFVVQILASIVDAVNGALMLPVPAATPVGSGIMGVLLAVALIRSRVESDRKKFQLEREKAGLLECVPQPLLYFGNDSRIEWANDNAAAFTGRELDELVGSPKDEVWSQQREELEPMEEALETGVSATREVTRDDGLTWIVHASPVMGPKDKPLGAIMLATDITEIRLTQEALREANVKILTAREEERRRVAQDLHDSVAQGLTALQMTLRAKAADMGTGTPQAEHLEQASQRCGELGTEVRQISHQLYPPALDLLGLAVALEEIFEPYRVTGKACSLECADDLRNARFSQNVEVALYRTAQEAINNAVRHGQAQEISIQLEQTDEEIRLSVTDNGIGFDVEKNKRGLGMTSMNSRVSGVGGKLEVASRPGRTVVTVSVPLEAARRPEEPAAEVAAK